MPTALPRKPWSATAFCLIAYQQGGCASLFRATRVSLEPVPPLPLLSPFTHFLTSSLLPSALRKEKAEAAEVAERRTAERIQVAQKPAIEALCRRARAAQVQVDDMVRRFVVYTAVDISRSASEGPGPISSPSPNSEPRNGTLTAAASKCRWVV